MPVYEYVATTSAGGHTSGQIEAVDESVARHELSVRGLSVVELTPRPGKEIPATLSGEQSAMFMQAAGAAATNRVPLEMTLSALAEERDDPHLADVARR